MEEDEERERGREKEMEEDGEREKLISQSSCIPAGTQIFQ